MYKTVTVWILSDGKKLGFQTDPEGYYHWLRLEGEGDGDVSFHFDAGGLRQFIEALEGLEKDMIKAKEEVVNNG